VLAANVWYWGGVTQVIATRSDGSFIVYTENPSIQSKCLYDRVNFLASDMGTERTKAALAMAMTALKTGREFGVVMDIQTEGQVCKVSQTTSQGAGIR
jgi:hypothetical protein